MKIEFNAVTWYSQIAAIVLFLLVFVIGFYVGMRYEFSKIPEVVEYSCLNKKTLGAQYYKDKVHLGLSDGREYTLPQVKAASGIRYANSDESIVYWSKGKTSFLQENSHTTYIDCAEAGI